MLMQLKKDIFYYFCPRGNVFDCVLVSRTKSYGHILMTFLALGSEKSDYIFEVTQIMAWVGGRGGG